MTYERAIQILRSIDNSWPKPRTTAEFMATYPNGQDELEVAQSIGRWYGQLLKGRELLLQTLLESS